MEPMTTPVYATSRLARLRKGANLTQREAALKLGMKHAQHLCNIERGWLMASGAVMKAMQEAYACTAEQVLRAAVSTYDRGPVIARQKARRRKLRTA